MAIKQNEFWDELIDSIETGMIIPVIGPDLVFFNDDKKKNLYEHLIGEIFLPNKPTSFYLRSIHSL